MRILHAGAAACLLALLASSPSVHAAQSAAAAPPSPVGRWLTANHEAVIDIEPCGTDLCGRIVGIKLDHPDDPIPTDHEGHSQCGLVIIRDTMPDHDDWSARIVDPRDGNVYDARLRVDVEHGTERRLHMRGYIGIPLFGHTQVWTAFDQPIAHGCRLPAP